MTIAFCALLLGLFLASFQASHLINSRISEEAEGKELFVTGTIKDIPSFRDDGVRFLFKVHSAELVDQPQDKIDLKGIVRLGWYQQPPEIHSGELWRLKVKLKHPSGFMNPGGFDYEKWLFTQRIIATGYVRESKSAESSVTATTADNKKLQQTITPEVLWSVDYWRQKIHENIQQQVDNKASAAVLSALLVAVRDKLDDKQWQLLQATGTTHLVAISGLHIAVVAGFAFFPMMLLWRLFPRLNERIPLRVAAAIIGTFICACLCFISRFHFTDSTRCFNGVNWFVGFSLAA